MGVVRAPEKIQMSRSLTSKLELLLGRPSSRALSQTFHTRLLGKSNGLCEHFEHASSAFIFASTSSDQFSYASSEHVNNYKWRAASTS